ncbi:Rqc2 family fibronectin-binding protein [Paratissierella segnis]|jgi:predicted ribosome quality control (RQC) complex YloA/Tae2 family protein|uniref:Rqc2 homolog RqcH n=1 Tax=Paratissierella segnis TaxID=2763679 RepID=A0A926IFM0_9FIRM|nr:NFACT family protein [Paratissierella segnis]MBC8588642.1 NFACT family protein [Paratissierella segnis]
MSFDGIVTNSVIKELKETILGGRIDKIYQQEKDEILINIYNKNENHKLVISSSSNNPRIYLTKFSKKNPTTPPVFCMLLRKHLSGGIVLNIEQFEMDRVVFIDISSIDELGTPTEKRLIVEIMGKHSNIILVDKPTNKIIDSVKRVSADMSRVRQILPGFIYQYPPIGDKKNPLKTSRKEFFSLLENENKNTPIYKFLYFNYLGLSPMISREICFQADIDIDRTLISLNEDDKAKLYMEFKNIMDLVESGNYTPMYITTSDKNDIIAFYSLDLDQYGNDNKVYLNSISAILDNVYRRKDIMDRINQKSHSIRKSIHVKLDRAQLKLGKQKEELFDSKSRDKYKVYADLISANIYKIPRGVNKIELENFYDENMAKLTVPLDIRLSPVDNAQKYYKKYSKLKNANQLLLEQIPETEKEIEYLENVLLSLENSTEIEELDEIKDELISEGYLKGNDKKHKRKKEEKVSKPMEFISSDNIKIYVGKNNKQNDYLTLKFSHREDLWLHVQGMPGSHVIIKSEGRGVPETTLKEAAILASYFSKGKNSKHVPVDYTQRKNVRKPKNAKTGMVIYDDYKTIIVDPDKNTVDNLSNEEL